MQDPSTWYVDPENMRSYVNIWPDLHTDAFFLSFFLTFSPKIVCHSHSLPFDRLLGHTKWHNEIMY